MARRTKIALFAAVLATCTVVLLELTLQLVSLATWYLAEQPESVDPAAPGTQSVDCVGDSYTYGIDTSSLEQSYPAQLERKLEERLGTSWRVVNGGRSGNNSRRVLQRADRLLPVVKPAFLCVVVGVNDVWSRPDELVLSPPPQVAPEGAPPPLPAREPFEWRFRTLRLFSIIRAWGAFSGEEQAAPTPPGEGQAERTPPREERVAEARFLGLWGPTGKGGLLRLEAGGRGKLGATPVVWRRQGQQLRLRLGTDQDATARLGAGRARLVLQRDGGGEPLRFHRPGRKPGAGTVPPPTEANAGGRSPSPATAAQLAAAGVTAFQFGHWKRAKQKFELALRAARRGSQPEIRIHAHLSRALELVGDAPERDEHVRWLRRKLEEQPTRAVAEAMALALSVPKGHEEVVAFTREAVRSYPESRELWLRMCTSAALTGDLTTAVDAIDKAIALTPARAHRGDLWRKKAKLFRRKNFRFFIECLVSAHLVDGDTWKTRLHLMRSKSPRLAEFVRAACDKLRVTEQQRQAVLALLHETVPDDSMTVVLRSHLRQLVQRCRHHGAEPILGSYPWSGSAYYAAGRSVAREFGVTMLDLHEDFTAAKTAQPDRVLFIADGHCNDAGYEIMAEAFAREIAGQLATRAERGR